MLLIVENLHFAYSDRAVLAGANLCLGQDQAIGLQGRNGSGKTTLFRCITGLETVQTGKILLNGQEIATKKDFRLLRRKVGFCLQNPEDQLFFPLVKDDVMFGPLNLGLNQAEAEGRMEEALALVGMSGFEKRLSYQLSGGQQKLIALAAVLAMRPQALLLDEPLNGLDELASAQIKSVLASLKCAKIIVSHDASFLRDCCGQVFELKDGIIIPAISNLG